MVRLSDEVIAFLERQSFVIIVSSDKDGGFHASCKGIVGMEALGRIALLDLYKGQTYANIRRYRRVSLVAVDEHSFKGFCLKGNAKVVKISSQRQKLTDIWENKIISRITRRLLTNISRQKSQRMAPESLFPQPEYLIVMEVENIRDLIPGHLSGDNLTRL